MENIEDYFFGIGLCKFLLHICIAILVRFHLLQAKILNIVVFQLLLFLLIIQYRVVRGCFLLSKLYVSLRLLLKLVEIYKLYGLS